MSCFCLTVHEPIQRGKANLFPKKMEFQNPHTHKFSVFVLILVEYPVREAQSQEGTHYGEEGTVVYQDIYQFVS